jgi:hypothetical protein
MAHTASASQPWLIALLITSVALALTGLAVMLKGLHLIARDRKAQRFKRRAWRQTRAALNRAGLPQKVVIDTDNHGTWRCTVNRRHDATECNGYHLNHDDL